MYVILLIWGEIWSPSSAERTQSVNNQSTNVNCVFVSICIVSYELSFGHRQTQHLTKEKHKVKKSTLCSYTMPHTLTVCQQWSVTPLIELTLQGLKGRLKLAIHSKLSEHRSETRVKIQNDADHEITISYLIRNYFLV